MLRRTFFRAHVKRFRTFREGQVRRASRGYAPPKGNAPPKRKLDRPATDRMSRIISLRHTMIFQFGFFVALMTPLGALNYYFFTQRQSYRENPEAARKAYEEKLAAEKREKAVEQDVKDQTSVKLPKKKTGKVEIIRADESEDENTKTLLELEEFEIKQAAETPDQQKSEDSGESASEQSATPTEELEQAKEELKEYLDEKIDSGKEMTEEERELHEFLRGEYTFDENEGDANEIEEKKAKMEKKN